ncbi:MauE/DoxX family redox-associated membrane protein [Sphaerisporangium corydalis]|uniref:MauE/DoxX family redox-associated membrane protein n=1 Tax=Sphaerisporangium corydalis TaxID=1441875 RepID=A0ABV9EJ88_9ACTN|nr:MauE/DoxX family redox-associated membrane protein [Sphaerisporangium corydalis]
MSDVLIACRGLIILVFAVAVAGKARNAAAFASFEASVRALKVAPRPMTRPLAVAVVAGELAVPPLLAFPATVVAGFAVAAVLLVAFLAAIVSALRRGTAATCRCFGVSEAPFAWRHVVRNALLTSVAVTGIVCAATGGPSPVHPAGAAVSIAVAAFLAFLVVIMDELAALFGPVARRS